MKQNSTLASICSKATRPVTSMLVQKLNPQLLTWGSNNLKGRIGRLQLGPGLFQRGGDVVQLGLSSTVFCGVLQLSFDEEYVFLGLLQLLFDGE